MQTIMKIRNIWNDIEKPLEKHKDKRGTIVDIFYKEKIEHVAIVDSTPNVVRGNHYHKKSTQYILVTKGSLEYWYKPIEKKEPAKMVMVKVGDLVTTPPLEIHALLIKQHGNQFIVFSKGTRGGSDYEKDTFRVMNIIK